MDNPHRVPEPHFQLIFDAAPSPFAILLPDACFSIVAVNEAYLKETLTVRSELVGQSIFEAFPDNPAAPKAEATKNLRASLTQVVATKKHQVMAIQHYDVPNRSGDGFVTRYWSPTNVPVLAPDGSLLYIIHRVENVTDYVLSTQANKALKARSESLQAELRKREAEVFHHIEVLSATNLELEKVTQNAKEWRAGEAKFRMITDALPQIVWTALPDGSLDYYNQQFYEFAGVPPRSAQGSLWANLVHPDDRESAEKAWRHSVTTGMPYETTFRVRHHSGEYRWTLARGLPVRDNCAVLKWVGSTTDIHEKKLAEEALQDAHRRKDEFLAMLAHELRNPLAPISAAAQLLSMTRSEDAQIKRVSDIICRQVGHVTSLVDDLLDVSRVTRGLIQLDQSILDVKQVVADAAEQVRPLIEERKHHLSLHLSPDKACVCGDHKRLVQVLSNLLNNAAKYTPEGGRLALTVEVSPAEVIISVIDNGTGMKPELVRNAFDLFQQGERTADRSQGGMGIGLALVKSLVKQHHGAVTASSKGPGQGSEFTVRLPRVEHAAKMAAAHAEKLPDGETKRLHILVVDDNVDAAQTMAMLLEMLGNEVVVEHEPGSALARARIESFDVYILDIGLPGIDGYELARQLRAGSAAREAMFVALSGYGQERDLRLSAAAGFARHYVKPVGLQQIQQLFAEIGHKS